jgi:hypothetical protein
LVRNYNINGKNKQSIKEGGDSDEMFWKNEGHKHVDANSARSRSTRCTQEDKLCSPILRWAPSKSIMFWQRKHK